MFNLPIYVIILETFLYTFIIIIILCVLMRVFVTESNHGVGTRHNDARTVARFAISFPTGPDSVRWTTERVVCVFTSKTMPCAMRLRLFTFRWHRSEKIKSNSLTKPLREHVQKFVSTNSRTRPAPVSYIFSSIRFWLEYYSSKMVFNLVKICCFVVVLKVRKSNG